MKLAAICFLLLLCFSFSSGQKTKSLEDLKAQVKKFKNNENYKITYDKFKDATGVWGVADVKKHRGNTLAFYFSYPGQDLRESIKTFLFVYTAYSHQWQFLRNTTWLAVIDGVRKDFGEGLRDSDTQRGIRSVQTIERLRYKIDREQIQEFVNSKSVDFRFGTHEISLTDDHRQMFKDMLSLATVE